MAPHLKPVSFKKGVVHAPRISAPYVPGRHSSRFWDDNQKAIIRKYYPTGGYAACALHLPSNKRSKSQIYCMARILGLKGPKGGGAKKRIKPPADIDDRIREFYLNGNGKKRGECDAFADGLKLPRWWVTKRATKLGLTMPHKKEPPWSSAETELMRKVPLHDPDRCAQIFREHGFTRSPTAIRVRAKRLEISRRFNEGFSATQAAAILGWDTKNLGLHCVSGEIKASKLADKRTPQQGGSRWVIKRRDLRQFVIDNLERVDLRKVEKFAFVDLLVRLEPEKEPPACK